MSIFSAYSSFHSFPAYQPASRRLQKPRENNWAECGTGYKCSWPTWRHWDSRWLPGPPSSSTLEWWWVGSPMWSAGWSAEMRTGKSLKEAGTPGQLQQCLSFTGLLLIRNSPWHRSLWNPSTSKPGFIQRKAPKNSKPNWNAYTPQHVLFRARD